MAIHVEILAAKLSQHYYLDGLAVTALLLLMTAGFLVPKDSPLDQWTGLAHTEQPLLCLAVCFVAEGLLCWKLVAAMKEREGNIASWLLANGLSTSASLVGMSTSMAKFIFIHQYAESCWTAGLLYMSYAAAKVSKLVLVFRFSRGLERGYEEFEADTEGSEAPEQPLKRTLRLKRLLCILWSATMVVSPAILLILYFMSANVTNGQEETDRRLAEVEKEVCQMSSKMTIAGGLVWFLGFAINTLILVMVAGALAVATDGPAALPVALVWIICVAENLGRVSRYTKCCLEMWEMFRKTTFAFAILPPRVRFGCD